MFLSLAKAGKFPVLIYESKMVSNSAWVSLGTLSDAGNFGACSSKCDSVSSCGAFAFDPASAYCELGEGLNLPEDEVSSGEGKQCLHVRIVQYNAHLSKKYIFMG